MGYKRSGVRGLTCMRRKHAGCSNAYSAGGRASCGDHTTHVDKHVPIRHDATLHRKPEVE